MQYSWHVLRTHISNLLLCIGVEFILPTDVIIADKFDENAESKVVAVDAIPDGWMVCLAMLQALE